MTKSIFSAKDKALLLKNGIPVQKAEEQLRRLKKGFAFVSLVKPCTAQDGIIRLSPAEQKSAAAKFLREAQKLKVLKFVPASGAASRMFQFLESEDAKHDADKKRFLRELPRFAFYSDLSAILKKQGQDIAALQRAGRIKEIAAALLDESGLGYRNAPKGMVLFHQDRRGSRTAFQEHLHEAKVLSEKAHLHFTLPEKSRAQIRRHLKQAARRTKFRITDSVQSPATQQLAAEKNGGPVRTESGELLLRPAGHGALLGNLAAQKADIIFVKNIDNILPPQTSAENDRWKLILGGVFLEIREKVFTAQKLLAKKKIKPGDLLAVLKIAAGLGWNGWGLGAAGARQDLSAFFNRPIRVCGMVPNSGEPGGGPFWTAERSGRLSAQIVESAEADLKDSGQSKAWKSSTHFNPVDFVCCLNDYRGRKWDLKAFADPERGMIAQKSYHGRDIRVMELPGLWNGSMARWLTLFVEVPAGTFVPVKTVLDLLRPEHQGRKGKKK